MSTVLCFAYLFGYSLCRYQYVELWGMIPFAFLLSIIFYLLGLMSFLLLFFLQLMVVSNLQERWKSLQYNCYCIATSCDTSIHSSGTNFSSTWGSGRCSFCFWNDKLCKGKKFLDNKEGDLGCPFSGCNTLCIRVLSLYVEILPN